MRGTNWVGWFIILLGVDLLLNNLGLPSLELGRLIRTLWPLALIWVGWDMIRKHRHGGGAP